MTHDVELQRHEPRDIRQSWNSRGQKAKNVECPVGLNFPFRGWYVEPTERRQTDIRTDASHCRATELLCRTILAAQHTFQALTIVVN
jgi:hypothetical protein